MIVHQVTIKQNKEIAPSVYWMVLEAPQPLVIEPGQFVNLQVKSGLLRRPISVSSIDENQFSILYQVVGKGTQSLAQCQPGDQIDLLGPLGTSFPIHSDRHDILLIGGGVGIAPLYEVAKRYRQLNKKVTVVLGGATHHQLYLEEAYRLLGCEVKVATMDGSKGTKGTVIDVIHEENLSGLVYSCGPLRMLEAVEKQFTDGYVSHEARMACGFGICMGCVAKKMNEHDTVRICKEGPVFKMGQVSYEFIN